MGKLAEKAPAFYRLLLDLGVLVGLNSNKPVPKIIFHLP